MLQQSDFILESLHLKQQGLRALTLLFVSFLFSFKMTSFYFPLDHHLFHLIFLVTSCDNLHLMIESFPDIFAALVEFPGLNEI